VELGAASIDPGILEDAGTIYGALDDAQFGACEDSIMPDSSADSQAYYSTMSALLVAYTAGLAQAKNGQEVARTNARGRLALQAAGPKPPPSFPSALLMLPPDTAGPAPSAATSLAATLSPALIGRLSGALAAFGLSPDIMNEPPKSLGGITDGAISSS
jgi:hypothetical protein